MTAHEYVALRLLDFGFELADFSDVWPHLMAIGYVEQREDGKHVTGRGRRAWNAWGRR